MQDIKLTLQDDGLYHMTLDEDGQIETIEGMGTSIIVSLLSDGRADESQVSDPFKRRGWIGDTLTKNTGRTFGSQLWTKDQARLNAQCLKDIEFISLACWNWMLEDGLATNIKCSVGDGDDEGSVNIDGTFTVPSGQTNSYSILWRDTDVNN